MISLLVCAVLGQFKVGDLVDLKPGGSVHRDLYGAVERTEGETGVRFFGEVIFVMSVAGERVLRVQCPIYERPGYMLEKWAVTLTEETADRYAREHNEKVERQREAMRPPSPEMIEAQRRNQELAAEEEKRRRMEEHREQRDAAAKIRYDASIAELRKYARNDPENEALDVAAKYGWNPLNLTADQINKLTPSQRKAISGIKLRYVKAKKTAKSK